MSGDLGYYTKAIVALIASVVTALATGIGGGDLGDLDGEGWVKVALVVVGGPAAVWFAENVTGVFGGVIKAVLASAGAFLAGLVTGYENDDLHIISQGELLTAVALALAALTATYQLRNVPPSGA